MSQFTKDDIELRVFLLAVYNELPPIVPDEIEHVMSIVSQLYTDGWTVTEAARMARLTEHVSPELSEDYALDRMHILSEQVRKRKEKTL